MTYSIHVIPPDEILTSDGILVEQETSIPLADVLASPSFETYPGLCIVVSDHRGRFFVGVFSESECVDITQDSQALRRWKLDIEENDLIEFWRTQTSGLGLLRETQNLISEKSLRKIAYHACFELSKHVQDSAFVAGVDFLQSPQNISHKDIIDSLGSVIYDEDSHFLDAAYATLITSIKMIHEDRSLVTIFASDAIWCMGWLGVADPRKLFADIVRREIPFHEIALAITK